MLNKIFQFQKIVIDFIKFICKFLFRFYFFLLLFSLIVIKSFDQFLCVYYVFCKGCCFDYYIIEMIIIFVYFQVIYDCFIFIVQYSFLLYLYLDNYFFDDLDFLMFLYI